MLCQNGDSPNFSTTLHGSDLAPMRLAHFFMFCNQKSLLKLVVHEPVVCANLIRQVSDRSDCKGEATTEHHSRVGRPTFGRFRFRRCAEESPSRQKCIDGLDEISSGL